MCKSPFSHLASSVLLSGLVFRQSINPNLTLGWLRRSPACGLMQGGPRYAGTFSNGFSSDRKISREPETYSDKKRQQSLWATQGLLFPFCWRTKIPFILQSFFSDLSLRKSGRLLATVDATVDNERSYFENARKSLALLMGGSGIEPLAPGL